MNLEIFFLSESVKHKGRNYPLTKVLTKVLALSWCSIPYEFLLPNQTGICSPAQNKFHLPTGGCGEGKCAFVIKALTRGEWSLVL